ncbi:MAG: hypothetical protein IT561_13030, partial [Alphaproteobacteria bacterium]|nr:hypothetical protein [Alphaproteobacteria bacterium]
MRDGAFAEGEQAMAALANDMLVGHVVAERLLHRRHRSSYRELAGWLREHADLPAARTIHALALKRRTPGSPAPRAPEAPVVDGMADLLESAAFYDAADGKPTVEEAGRSREPKGRMTAVRLRVRQLLKQGDLDAAERVARSAEARGLAGDERLQVRADLVRFSFFAGRDDRAVDLVPVAEEAPVTAHWFAGLAAWRLRRLDVALRHFETVAGTSGTSGWLIAAGAYWAARSQRALGAPEAAQALLR